jgi:hypothetical protein
VAFKAASSNGDGNPHLTSASPLLSGSPSAGPSTAPAPTHTVSSVPVTSSTAASSPATSSTATDTGTSTGTGTPGSSRAVADPHQLVTAAWLAPGQLPFASTYKWTASSSASSGGQALSSTVAYIPNTANYQALTICADPTQLLSRTEGAQLTNFAPTVTGGNNQASQFIFFFSSASAAQQTYTWLQSQYTSSCLINGSGAQITRTGSDGTTGVAWLTLKGTSSLPDLADYTREYFVLRGSTIAYVSMTSYTSTPPTSYDDAAQLATIAAHLCVYGGPCS